MKIVSKATNSENPLREKWSAELWDLGWCGIPNAVIQNLIPIANKLGKQLTPTVKLDGTDAYIIV
jgi:hypothetical protein